MYNGPLKSTSFSYTYVYSGVLFLFFFILHFLFFLGLNLVSREITMNTATLRGPQKLLDSIVFASICICTPGFGFGWQKVGTLRETFCDLSRNPWIIIVPSSKKIIFRGIVLLTRGPIKCHCEERWREKPRSQRNLFLHPVFPYMFFYVQNIR